MTITLLAATSGTAWAGAPSEETRPLRVEIDVSAIAEADRPHIERFTRERIGPLLQERSFVESDAAEDSVSIRVDYLDAEDLEYAIYVDVYDDGEKVQPGIDWFVCKFCPQGMVADTIAKELPAALDLLDQAEASEAAQDDTEPQVESGGQGTSPDQPIKPIGWPGITGAVAAGGGLAMTIAGSVRLAQGEVIDPSDSPQANARDFRPQGLVLVGVGATVLAVGTTALVVDLVLRKKKRKEVSVHPALTPHTASVAFSVRF